MISKKKILVATMAALMLMGVSARAGIYTASPNETITSGVGISSTVTSSGEVGTISSITVSLQISGGINGALYGYLSYNGVLVTLLNQPGTGPGNPLGNLDSGFSVVLSDIGAGNINDPTVTSSTPLTGTYNVNGTAGNGSAAFGSAYGGDNPNGTWTLYLENDISGSDPSTLVSWSVAIDAVPEPTNIALGIFGVCAVAGRLRAGWKKSRASAKTIDDPK